MIQGRRRKEGERRMMEINQMIASKRRRVNTHPLMKLYVPHHLHPLMDHPPIVGRGIRRIRRRVQGLLQMMHIMSKKKSTIHHR